MVLNLARHSGGVIVSNKKFIVANWKMNKTVSEAEEFLKRFISLNKNIDIEVAICPPFLCLEKALKICKESKIKIESSTIGTPVDMGISDANHMGAVMAPAAASTLVRHLSELNRDVDYYDLILTGDLGCVGKKILEDYLEANHNIKLKKYLDAGCELLLDIQETYAGGSGPACLPLVLFNKILTTKKYKKILIIATGALHSVTLVNQKKPIPAIAHALSLEVL